MKTSLHTLNIVLISRAVITEQIQRL